MKHEIIRTGNYLLVTDDSEIKFGDRYFSEEGNMCLWQDAIPAYHKLHCGKIIAHLPLDNSPVLEGVPLLPPLGVEDDVEKLVRGHFEKDKELNNPSSFKAGYNKAKEKYRFTEEDMREAMRFGGMRSKLSVKELDDAFQSLIQHVTQPKVPVGFECEMVNFEVDMGLGDECTEYGQYPKTITNSQGQLQLVGEWVFEGVLK